MPSASTPAELTEPRAGRAERSATGSGGARTSVLGLAQALSGSWSGVVIMLVGVALCLPAIGNGFVLDDHMHRLMANGGGGVDLLARGPFGLFRFLFDEPTWRADAELRGFLPWYAAPHLHATFFRPLPSALLWLEYRSDVPRALAHLHDLAWYAFALGAVWWTYRTVFARHVVRTRLAPAAIAGLAGLAFALDEAHGLAVGWSANRHAAMATGFAAVALGMHVRWRFDGDRVAGVLAPALLAVGLVCGELALSVTAYLFAYAAVLDRGTRARRIASLLPGFLVSVAWLWAYRWLDYGAGDSALYTDPIGDPAGYLAVLPVRLALLLAGQWTPLQAEAAVFLPPSATVPIVASAVVMVVAVAVAAVRHLRSEAVAAFFAIGMVVGALPACAVFASDRNLLIVGIGAFGLFASWWAATIAPADPERRPAGRYERAVLGVLLVVHLVVAPLQKPLRTASPGLLGTLVDQVALSLDDAFAGADDTLVVVTATDFFTGPVAIAAIRRSMGRPAPGHLRTLHTGYGSVTVTRVAADTLEIEADDRFQSAPFDRLLRPDRARFRVGDAFAFGEWTATVSAIDGRGRPTRVRFASDRPLDAPELRWVALGPDGYVPFPLPEVGTSVVFAGMSRRDVFAFAGGRFHWPRPPVSGRPD